MKKLFTFKFAFYVFTLLPISLLSFAAVNKFQTLRPVASADDWIHLTTSAGTGADGQVQGGGNATLNVGSRNNAAIRNAGFNGGNYTTYLRFDLSSISAKVLNSKLKLTLATTASSANEFSVYGLIDGFTGGADEGTDPELGEDWAEGTQDWNAAVAGVINGDRAPGYNETAGLVNTSKATLLGTLKLTDGLAIGSTIEFASDKLTEFINADTNKKITIILSGVSGNFSIKTKEAGAAYAPDLMYMISSSDVIAPPAPTNLAYSNLISNSVTLNWSASIDENSGTAGYNVYVNGNKYNSTLLKSTTFQINDLISNTDYSIKVTAVDVAGNESTFSTAVTFKNQDFTLKAAFVSDNDFAGPESAPKADELFTIKAEMSGNHPRILFSGVSITDLIARTQNPYYNKYWTSIKNQALAAAQKIPPIAMNPANEDPWREYGRGFNWMAIAYKLDTDASRKAIYLNGIVTWINAFYNYERSNQDLALSHLVIGVSCVYDWLFNDLPAETKAKARYIIIDNSRWLRSPTNAGATMWRDKQFSTNHNWYNHTALAMAGVALYGETAAPLDPKEPAIWFSASVRNFWETQRRLTVDGVPVEGYNYTDYGLPPYIDMGVMVEQLTTPSAKLNLLNCPAIKNQGKARLQLMLPNDYGFMAWSDSYWKHFNGSWIYRFLAHRFADGESQYLADWLDARGDADWRGLLWADASVIPVTKESIGLTMDATDMDFYTVRSSWANTANFFAFKCGNAGGKTAAIIDRNDCTGHCHPDANIVEFWWKDNPVLRVPGYSTLKATNNSQLTSFIVNGVTVEQKGGGQDWFRSTDYGLRLEDAYTLEAIHTEKYHTFLGESGGLYLIDGVKCNYRRRVVYIPGGSVVIADRVSAPKAIDFEFRLLLPTNVGLTNSGNMFNFTSGGTAGKIIDYSSGVSSRSITDLTMSVWDTSSQNRKVVGIKKSNTAAAQFGVVINMGDNNTSITQIDDNGIKVMINGVEQSFGWEAADDIKPAAPALVDIWQAYPKVLFVQWPVATDNIKVVGYKVYVDGVFYKSTILTNATINSLKSSTKYTIGVTAIDWKGNESELKTSSAFTLNPDGTTVSALENPNEDIIKLYPNPAFDKIQISLNSNFPESNSSYSIADLTGKIVQSGKINGAKTSVDISDLPTGLYIMNLQTGNKNYFKKIIKRGIN